MYNISHHNILFYHFKYKKKKVQMNLSEDSRDSKCSSKIKTGITARVDKTPNHFHLGGNRFDF